MKKTPTTSVSAFVTRAPEGLTADGVQYSIRSKTAKIPQTKLEVLRSLPVSLTECASFTQHSGYVNRDVVALESRTPLRFHVEQHGMETLVWRVA